MPSDKPCSSFAQFGICSWTANGEKCPYSHDVEESEPARRGGRGKFGNKNNKQGRKKADLGSWQNKIFDLESSASKDDAAVMEVFSHAKELLDSGSAEIQYEVIQSLASDQGLRFVSSAVDSSIAALRTIALPFLQVLAHRDANSSLLLEEHVATIYSAFYGTNGAKAQVFFNNIATLIGQLKGAQKQNEEFRNTLASALEVLVHVISLDLPAKVPSGIRDVINKFEAVGANAFNITTPQTNADLSAISSMRILRVILEHDQNAQAERVASIVQQNLPGALRQGGPRHDNDFADIADIQIMPTNQEVLSTVPEYLPTKNPAQHHRKGIHGLLDRQFRLLREDTVGQLRDAVRPFVMQNQNGAQSHGVSRGETMRTNVLRNAVITDSFFERNSGLLHVIEFDQPRRYALPSEGQRHKAWSESSDLAVEGCVCMVGPGTQVNFYTIVGRDPVPKDDGGLRLRVEKSKSDASLMNLYKDGRRAAIIVQLVNTSGAAALDFLTQQDKQNPQQSRGTLIEFPGILLVSFIHSLEVLQRMSQKLELPLSDVLAPISSTQHAAFTGEPPSYARKAGFEFDLSQTTKGAKMQFSPQRKFDFGAFSQASGLDESQSRAFIHALSNKMALIQGPPGTGKSFVGVQLIQTLLQNRDAAKLGPILCVCYTNHALDQILEHLLEAGVHKIVRIGGRSKSESLAKVNLRVVAQTIDVTRHDKDLKKKAGSSVDAVEREARFALHSHEYAKSADEKKKALLHIQQLCNDFEQQKRRLDSCRGEVDLRCLRKAHIIGITTTGVAKSARLLKKANAKVLIVEEAGEVMEAHMLPNLLPSLEHVIAIGDHQQLRPSIARYDLSVESHQGAQYSLDVSQFERLIYPEPGLPRLLYTTLLTQRRMHPLISRIIRDTIYPKLANGGHVAEHPEITSMCHRLFWYDHQNPENSETGDVSKSNDFEVDMTAALVSHLIKQGTYKPGQITVLTPYLAQFRKLRRRFASITQVVVGEKDQKELTAKDIKDEAAPQAGDRVSLNEGLRISTVDNYQGEESDIIVVSLVRSNKAGQVGFLRTPNRINVLLSRARHGMYIIGNAILAKEVPMWKKVIGILETDKLIGSAIPFFCPRHPQTIYQASSPNHFSKFAPDGGCTLICQTPLKCKHACPSKCHAPHLHDAVICQVPCPRKRKTCTHGCNKVCGVACDEKCQVLIPSVKLRCGHVAPQLKCFETQALEKVKCHQKVVKTIKACSHRATVACHEDVRADIFCCPVACGGVLKCGHKCTRKCSECNFYDWSGGIQTNHGACSKGCDGQQDGWGWN